MVVSSGAVVIGIALGVVLLVALLLGREISITTKTIKAELGRGGGGTTPTAMDAIHMRLSKQDDALTMIATEAAGITARVVHAEERLDEIDGRVHKLDTRVHGLENESVAGQHRTINNVTNNHPAA